MTIGFIGLGRMGGAMAARLIAVGHEVVVRDVDAGAVEVLAAQGAQVADTARDVGDLADIVFASLPTPDIVLDTVLGSGKLVDGKSLRIFVDLSTSGPRAATALDQGLRPRRIGSIDAPVSGGIKGAREGTLALMTSGPLAALEEVRPLLEVLGKPFFMGETPGAGQTMKLVNNLLGACAIAITSEGMAMGIKAGLDPAKMIEVLNGSTGRNSATEDKWPRAVLPRTFDFGFATGLCLKDVRLCVGEAEAAGVPLAVGSAVRTILERTADTYGPDSDFTAMAKLVEADAGLDPERPA
jgi:3-hydroxyisobutyrate dehydrogenase-like beta-hydroxyacid dehydrogenase